MRNEYIISHSLFFVWLGEWGIMMFRWCDAVMQGRTAVLPLKSVQPNLLSLEFESIKKTVQPTLNRSFFKGGGTESIRPETWPCALVLCPNAGLGLGHICLASCLQGNVAAVSHPPPKSGNPNWITVWIFPTQHEC